MDLIGHLEQIENTRDCQVACQNIPNCNFFTFHQGQEDCKLQVANFGTRVCDIVHGTPSPSFQTCLLANEIPWAKDSGKTFVYSSLVAFV